MWYPEIKSGLEIFFPTLIAHRWCAVNKIDGDVLKSCILRHLHAILGLHGIVCAVHQLQVLIKKTLNANAEAVHGSLLELAQFIFGEIVRVRLKGDLRIRIDLKITMKMIEDACNFIAREQGRSTTTEINRADPVRRQIAFLKIDFSV